MVPEVLDGGAGVASTLPPGTGKGLGSGAAVGGSSLEGLDKSMADALGGKTEPVADDQGRDMRLLPLTHTSRERRLLSFKTGAELLQEPEVDADWHIEGPPTVCWCCDLFRI